MRLRFFGGFAAEADGEPLAVRGRGQEALLFRLALDTGTTVSYRSLAEDVWPNDPPEDPRSSLHSLASRLRRALPTGALEAVPGGYRLAVERYDVDVALFQDLVTRARSAADAGAAATTAREALALWIGDPWVPDAGFDWVVRDLWEDRAHAERLARADTSPAAAPVSAASVVPAALTPLVGRLRELDLLESQLSTERLVTLIGPGGAGKTTLAFETARRHPGAILVELAPAAPGEVWAALAGAVGRSIRISDATAAPTGARDRVLESLAGRSLLVVLDNCEHVSAEAAVVALELLRGAPGTRILATSREPLGLAGEAFVDLGPLPERDALELFEKRVRAARGTAPASADAEAAARIVRRLDGLPLALELAAAKARTLTLAEIDEGLDDRFALLGTGPRGIEARHQTLRALIDWSWETLSAPERTALLATAVFPDGIGSVDLGEVARRYGVGTAAFDALVDKSLLHRADRRLRMLETVREYGIGRLQDEGALEAFRATAAEAMASLAAAHDAILRGPAVRDGLAWFDANEENLSAALRTCADQSDLHEAGIRLVRSSIWTWLMRERFEEMHAAVARFAGATEAPDSEAAVVVEGVGLLFVAFVAADGTQQVEGIDPGTAFARFEERAQTVAAAARSYPSELTAALIPLLHAMAAAVRAHEPGAPWSRGFTLPEVDLVDAPDWTRAFLSMLRSALAQNGGDIATLGAESEKALDRFTALGDVWGIAFASQMRSEWLQLAGRLEEALAVADASTVGLTGLTSVSDVVQQHSQGIGLLTRLGRIDEARARVAEIDLLARSDGSQRALAQSHMNAAMVEIAVGDGTTALQHLDAIALEMGPGFPEQIIAWAQSKRAQALVLLDRLDDARAALAEALPSAARSGDQPIIADVALSLAGWLAASGRSTDARRAIAASARLRGGDDASDPFLQRIRPLLGTDATTGGDPEEDPTPEVDDIATLVALLG
ncbi:ATPase [Microbacterium sp. Root61]|uniref:ATP-binding protein n=1 Tax=Microbacterium sp. Root61 TaxID=1736570 RepID=UPI0006FC038F|nr:NB-ARC domain-containing protein [Microbacterium sp. Root61]KRA25508.1 ATPase [Microbacterium sp. Root61]